MPVVKINVKTNGQGLYECTSDVKNVLKQLKVSTGLLTVMIRHTSASLIIQENADPSARRDLETFLNKLVPENQSWYTHTAEGSDDMPAHIKAALTQTSIGIPFLDGRLCLGTWQGLYVWEHRRRSHSRELVIHVLSDDKN